MDPKFVTELGWLIHGRFDVKHLNSWLIHGMVDSWGCLSTLHAENL